MRVAATSAWPATWPPNTRWRFSSGDTPRKRFTSIASRSSRFTSSSSAVMRTALSQASAGSASVTRHNTQSSSSQTSVQPMASASPSVTSGWLNVLSRRIMKKSARCCTMGNSLGLHAAPVGVERERAHLEERDHVVLVRVGADGVECRLHVRPPRGRPPLRRVSLNSLARHRRRSVTSGRWCTREQQPGPRSRATGRPWRGSGGGAGWRRVPGRRSRRRTG